MLLYWRFQCMEILIKKLKMQCRNMVQGGTYLSDLPFYENSSCFKLGRGGKGRKGINACNNLLKNLMKRWGAEVARNLRQPHPVPSWLEHWNSKTGFQMLTRAVSLPLNHNFHFPFAKNAWEGETQPEHSGSQWIRKVQCNPSSPVATGRTYI